MIAQPHYFEHRWLVDFREIKDEAFIRIQAGNFAVHGGEERDMVRNNRRSVADRLPLPNATYMNVVRYT
ncbi:hypothetical protein [Halocatena marina]|uniref:hypothetical protein n=1 Tax=Halocatena marina TaxID=2934937 RepID=UPI00200DE05C|nr:hypothetical protein [Halocatena marina]